MSRTSLGSIGFAVESPLPLLMALYPLASAFFENLTHDTETTRFQQETPGVNEI